MDDDERKAVVMCHDALAAVCLHRLGIRLLRGQQADGHPPALGQQAVVGFLLVCFLLFGFRRLRGLQAVVSGEHKRLSGPGDEVYRRAASVGIEGII